MIIHYQPNLYIMDVIPGGNFYSRQLVQQVMPLQLYQYLIPKLRDTRELPKRSMQKYMYFVKNKVIWKIV